MSGSASARASASQQRGLSRKSNIICARSLGPPRRRAQTCSISLGGDVGLAQQHRVAAQPLGLLTPGVHDRKVLARADPPGLPCSRMNGAASIRKPATPSCSQKLMTLVISARTAGLAQLRSGWKSIEAMEVPRLRLLVEGPGLALLAREDGALMPVRSVPRPPDIPVAVRRIRAAPGRDEPGMLVGGVVDDQVEDDPDAALLRLGVPARRSHRGCPMPGRCRSSR